MSFQKIKEEETNRYNTTIVPLKELFTSVFIITAIVVGVSLIVLDIANNDSSYMLFFESVFAQTSHQQQQQVQINYNSIQISNTGQIQGKIIIITMDSPTTTTATAKKADNKIIQDKPIQQQITIKAIGVGQTSIHCFNIDDKKHQVRTSQPFLATAQKSMTVSQKNIAFTLQLNPNVGNVSCDKLSIVAGPTTTFINVGILPSQ